MDEYIKRDALLNEISQQKAMSAHSFPRRHFTVNDVLTCIKTAPATDVAPVVHAKWEYADYVSSGHVENIYTCSACRNYYAWGEMEKTPCCPSCGAKMDLEE